MDRQTQEHSGTRRRGLRPPNLLYFLLEGPRAMAEASTLLPSLPLLRSVPAGDGHPVLVLPGFTASDDSTRVLREYLRDRGYAVHGWKLGRNMGLPDGVEQRLMARVLDLHQRHGRKLSLVGWSLGGIYARELARLMPDKIRQVITLGSPFGGNARGHHVGWAHRMVFGEDVSPRDYHRLNQLAAPPPVPSTAIFSRSDGIAGWRACIEAKTDLTDNIEVRSSHCGLGFNPVVLYAIADRLALAEDGWQPFEPRGLRRLLFG